MKKTKTKSYLIYWGIVAALVSAIVAIVFYVNAYFTATSSRSGDLSFHNIELEIDSTNKNGSLFAASITSLVPGNTINLRNVSVRNSGSAEIYSLINFNIYITRPGYTDYNIDYWYNLSGEEINVNNMESNSNLATNLSVGGSVSLNLVHTFDGSVIDNSFKGATGVVSLRAVGIQTANLPNNPQTETEKATIATNMLVDDYYTPKSQDIVNMNTFETQPVLRCASPTETETIQGENYDRYNITVDNLNDGDTVYVQGYDAEQIIIAPGKYSAEELITYYAENETAPEGGVVGLGNAVASFTSEDAEVVFLGMSSSNRTLDITIVVLKLQSKTPTIRIYSTPTNNLPSVENGLGVYVVDYADVKTGVVSCEVPIESGYEDMSEAYPEILNFKVDNVNEDSEITVFALAGYCLLNENYNIKSALEELMINYDKYKFPFEHGLGVTFNVKAGESLKFAILTMKKNVQEESYGVQIYCNAQNGLPVVKENLAYHLLDDGSGYSVRPAHHFAFAEIHFEILDNINGLPVKEISNNFMSGNTSFFTISIGKNIEVVGEGAFGSSYPYPIDFEGTNLREIGPYAFANMESLSINFGENSKLTTIGEGAFSGTYGLESITIPNSVTSIGDYAFSDCKFLENILFEESSNLTIIGNNAFSGCSNLKSITIPSSVMEIGNFAFGETEFNNCNELREITLQAKQGYVWAVYDASNGGLVKYVDEVADMAELIGYGKGDYRFKQILDKR